MPDRNMIVTPDNSPDRFTEEEAEYFRQGRCCWLVEYGNGRGEIHCGERSEPGASFGYCAEHNAELLEEHHPDGSRRR